ncbi:MAG TPA: CBO0543 family protein [Bacilli bacterium]|nr:CBO0543 family protein [Bacilli bacterium]
MKETTIQDILNLFESIEQKNTEISAVWHEGVVFTRPWWIMIGLLVLPWCLFWLFRKKSSTHRLMFAGFFVYVVASTADSLGVPFGLWCYLVTPLPYLHTFYQPLDLSMLPVFTMFFLQVRPQTSPLGKALLYAGVLAFGAEPLLIRLDVYRQLEWSHLYSFPCYVLIYLAAHYMSRRRDFAPLE